MALIQSTIYQQDLRRFHDRNVKSRAFQEGDLVLRVDQQKPHKLAPTWEGPFIVTRFLHNGAYHLYNVDRQIDEPRAWNAELLRPFYTWILTRMRCNKKNSCSLFIKDKSVIIFPVIVIILFAWEIPQRGGLAVNPFRLSL